MSRLSLAYVLLGVVLCLPLVAYGRHRRREMRLYAVALVVAALVYVVAAALGGSREDLAGELAGMALFGGLAWLAVRRWPWLLVVGWAGHPAWDLLRGASAYLPEWYLALCVGFDLTLAGYILGRHAGVPR